MRRRLIFLAAVVLSGCPVSHPPVPAASCRHPGDLGNELGIGQFCYPEADDRCPRGTSCLASVGSLGGWERDRWYCSTTCTVGGCGSDAACVAVPGVFATRYCVPRDCIDRDAGVDGGPTVDSGE